MSPRKSVNCRDCGQRKASLKWCALWDRWLCLRCVDRRLDATVEEATR